MTKALGTMSRALIVDYFAQFGVHCETARLIFGKTMPRALLEECERARTQFLAAEAKAAP